MSLPPLTAPHREHGLDWTRMAAAPGLATGWFVPEQPLNFLARDLWEARLMVDVVCGHGRPLDVWAVRVADLRLDEFDGWIVCREPISPGRLELVEADVSPREEQGRRLLEQADA